MNSLATRSTRPPVTEAVDDYLKAILEISGQQEERVTSNALAERLGVRAASVTGMLQKLALQRPSLVAYEKHHGVLLSPAGKRRAWELVRHHRILELFLHDVLKYSWDEVHEEAERLEHFISERFEDRVAAILGDPEIDPHGHPIPQKDGIALPRKEVPLLKWALHHPATISSVMDRDSAALRQLEKLKLLPGLRIEIVQQNSGALIVKRLDQAEDEIRVSNELARCVLVVEAAL